MLMPRKRLTARKQKIQVKILQVLIPAEEDSAEADDTAAEAESTGEDSASSDSTEADSAEVADSKETESSRKFLLVQQPRLQTVMHTARLFLQQDGILQ